MKALIRKAIQESPLEVIDLLLNTGFWLQSLNANQSYVRFEDDSRQGMISINFSMDGDGWIQVISQPDDNDFHLSMRFRTAGPVSGGGESPRTRAALLILAEAIRLDNEKNPQHRGEREDI
jgi:hypothetical protein